MLSERQTVLLHKATTQFAPMLSSLVREDAEHLSLEERNALRSALGDLLSVEGFDEDWNATAIGREIEELIDVLGPK